MNRWIPNENSKSVMALDPWRREISCNQIKQIKIIWMLELDSSHHSTIASASSTDLSPRFEWHTMISQSARADETNHSFARRFYQTVQNDFLSVNSRSTKGPGWSYTRGKNVNSWAPPHLYWTLRHWAKHSPSYDAILLQGGQIDPAKACEEEGSA